MNNAPDTWFDFDEWLELAQSDPEAFERRRQRMIEDIIAEAPENLRHRLRCLQWRIDMERARASNPMSACVRLSKMLWDMVYGDNGLLKAMETLEQMAGQPAPCP